MPTTRSAHGARTLDAKYFLSPDIYAQETERIFRREWLCAGRGSELPAVGDRLCRSVASEDLILIRGDDGEVRAFHNVCRHRGTRLCSEPQIGRGGPICCPYHGWTYATDGRLLHAPNMTGVSDFSAAEYPLHAAAAAAWQGFFLVHLGQPTEENDEPRQRFEPHLAAWELGRLISVHQIVYDLHANWKLIFQNYNECYHCPRVHPRLNAMSSYQTAANVFENGPLLGGPMRLTEGVASMTVGGRACGPRLPKLNAEQQRQVFYFSLFPTLLISPHPDFVLVHRIERQGPTATRVVCDFLFAPEAAAAAGFDPAPAIEFWDQTNREDWRVCELTQQGIKSPAYRPGPYSNLESVVAAFDRHYLAVLAPESPVSPEN